MTRTDFYILQTDQSSAVDLFACRLAEKAQRNDIQVLIAVDDHERAAEMDALLWGFREDSFVPHGLQNVDSALAVEINTGQSPGGHHGLLINLCRELPRWFSQFERLAEIVLQQSDSLTRSRRRYSYFRDRGYPLQSHPISNL